MLIYFNRCCVNVKYRLLKQKKETKKLQKNNCCWYIETKVGSFVLCCVYVFCFYQNIFSVVTFVLEYISFILMTKRHVNLF
jgi:hypothetical protein